MGEKDPGCVWRSLVTAPTAQKPLTANVLKIFVSPELLLCAGNWDSTFNIYSNRKENNVPNHNMFLFMPFPILRAAFCGFSRWARRSAPLRNIQLNFGTKGPAPKSIAADENQPIDLNWLWGRILDAEVAKIAGGLGIAVCSCERGSAMGRLELALFWLPHLFK